MKNWKKYASLLLALVLCLSLSLAACSGGNGDNGDDIIDGVDDTAPDTIEGIVIDDSVEYDYSAFLGTWLGEDNNVLAAEEYDDGRVHYTLSDANDDWIASGLFQYAEEYGYVYAHNDFDGIAYICRFYEDDTLYIDSFGTFTKVSGDVPGETVGDDTEETVGVNTADAPETIFDSTILGDPVEYDYSAFLGTWVGTDGTTLTVEEDGGEGAPFVLLDRYGDPYTQGVLQYVEEYGCVYAIDDAIDVATKCWFNEDDKLEIPGYSKFSKVTGEESDYIVICGTWYPGGDTSASRCIEFDSSGTMWSIYERTADGLWDGVDGGTLRANGNNQYEAVSSWYDGETFDCYFEDDMLYWGSEDGSYEEYY